MTFPVTRLRRLRATATWRAAVRETRLAPTDFLYPLFIVPGRGVRQPVASMPGIAQLSVDEAVREAREVAALGISGLMLFGVPEAKDARASAATDPDGLVPRAIAAIKEACPGLLVWADVCLCGATDHGHCGHVTPAGTIDNDTSLETLAAAALVYARAGADAVAPSDMMDGRVAAIRRKLDESGLTDVPIVSYAAKYASGLYGPFRDAAQSTPAFGDRRSYQMDPANAREALLEVDLDIGEGADLILIKPAGLYLDVIRRVRERIHQPIVAYQVSGEYSLVKAAAERGWVDARVVALESLMSIRRAGADLTITYFAKEASRWLQP